MYSLEEITQIALGDSEKKDCWGVELCCCFYFVYMDDWTSQSMSELDKETKIENRKVT
jgi:hypothetical protein